MQAVLYNDWWTTTDTGGSMGSTDSSNVTDKQQHNASKILAYFRGLGWTVNAIAAMVGNMQLESWLSPGLIQGTNRYRLPNSAANLSDVPNSVMINFYDSYYGLSHGGFGIGLVQWDGSTNTPPAGQKLVSFAERYNMIWYDGDTQIYRIRREQESNIQWQAQTLGSTYWTWTEFIASTETPEELAYVWRVCYEVADPGTDATRRANARYWYDWFIAHPTTGLPSWMYFLFNRKKVLKNVRRRI